MSEVAIKVENISKLYQIGAKKKGSFRESFSGLFSNAAAERKVSEFWALRDVSFEIKKGDAVGFIGKNGAGKSTLLKILSRITEPSTGRVNINGRVSSLLEVGTGFHPELTGRENIFLNGTILGMKRKEVKYRFDEIVEFSGVSKFIDTAVKHYSSGMYVRLAFAVAAHLEPEILIIDEVLAVGDAEFQKKCLGKMEDVSKNFGRTILFVSHSMSAIQNLCNKAIYLDAGKVMGEGPVDEQIGKYLKAFETVKTQSLSLRTDRQGSGLIKFTSVLLADAKGEVVGSFTTGQDVKFILTFERKQEEIIKNLSLAIGINDNNGIRITNLNTEVTQQVFREVGLATFSIAVEIDRVPLMPGNYDLTIYSTIDGEVADWIQNAFSFTVESGDFYGTGKLIPAGQGSFLIKHKFKLLENPTC